MSQFTSRSFAAIPTKIEPANQTPSIDYSVYESPFDASSSFHPFCFVDFTLNNQTDVEQCWLGDANVPLPDLDTEDNDIVQMLNTWVANLTKTYSVDGLRIDTVKHIRKDFWPDFAKSAGVFTLGEVWWLQNCFLFKFKTHTYRCWTTD